MKLNFLPFTITIFLLAGIDNNLYSQYSKLEGRDLELYRKEITTGIIKQKDLFTLLELTTNKTDLAKINQDNLKSILSSNTKIWSVKNQLNVVVSKQLEKSEYALIKKWLYDQQIKVVTNQHFFVIKTISK